MKTLSIDASTKATGIAVFDQSHLIHYQCINADDRDKLARIKIMINNIQKIIQQYNPTDVIVQDILPEDVKHNQAVFKALIYLQAGIALLLHKYGLTMNLCTASHWRSQVGIQTGRGIKRDQLKLASKKLVKAIYNIEVNDDISDAICIGISYIKQNRSVF